MPAPRYLKAPGVLFESIGEGWVAFSPLSGETHLLNSETVAVVETLDVLHPLSALEVAERLADDSGTAPDELVELLEGAWAMLLQAGLVRLDGVAACSLT